MINRVILVGRVERKPQIRRSPEGRSVAHLLIATSRSSTDKASGVRREDTDVHDVEVWDRQAEICGEHLAAGRMVYVEGHLESERPLQDDARQERSRAKIVAELVKFLGGGPSRAIGKEPAAGAGAQPQSPQSGSAPRQSAPRPAPGSDANGSTAQEVNRTDAARGAPAQPPAPAERADSSIRDVTVLDDAMRPGAHDESETSETSSIRPAKALRIDSPASDANTGAEPNSGISEPPPRR